MKYLKIKNWDKFQTFRKDRGTPPWIKVYNSLLSNSEWVQLSDAEKGQLISMWLIASTRDGQISDCPKILRKTCMLDAEPNLQRFKDLGLLVGTVATISGSAVAAPRQQGDAAEESRVEKSRKTLRSSGDDRYKDEFEKLWVQYPNKKGKQKAWLKFRLQVTTPEELASIKTCLVHYIEEVQRQRRGPHPDLQWQHGSTWFNCNWTDYFIADLPPSHITPLELTAFEKEQLREKRNKAWEEKNKRLEPKDGA